MLTLAFNDCTYICVVISGSRQGSSHPDMSQKQFRAFTASVNATIRIWSESSLIKVSLVLIPLIGNAPVYFGEPKYC